MSSIKLKFLDVPAQNSSVVWVTEIQEYIKDINLKAYLNILINGSRFMEQFRNGNQMQCSYFFFDFVMHSMDRGTLN